MNTLVLSYTIDGDQVHLTPRLRRNRGGEEVLPQAARLCPVQRLLDAGAAVTLQLQQALSAVSHLSPPEDLAHAAASLGALRQAGHALTRLLLPEAVVAELDPAGGGHVIFECDPRLNAVPFHLSTVGGDFLCLRFAVGKRLWTPVRRPPQPQLAEALPWRAFSLIDPGALLPGKVVGQFPEDAFLAGGPMAQVFDFGPMSVSRAVRKDRLQAELREARVVNFFGHHQYDDANPEASGWVLAEGSSAGVFTGNDLLDALGHGAAPPQLIFSAGCDSGITNGWETTWPETGTLHGLVDAACRAGIPHYVGGMVEIPMERAAGVFLPFYSALADGRSIGEALRLARLTFRESPQDTDDGGTLFALPYVLYGDPTVGAVCAGGHPAAGASLVFCEAPGEDRPCGRLVCERDAGFADRRCAHHAVARTVVRCSAGHAVADASALEPCGHRSITGETCGNTVCPECSGWGKRLCYEHVSFEGRRILAGAHKLCDDPDGRHPGVKRSVAPGEAGWKLVAPVLCRECRQDQAYAADSPSQ